MCRAGMGGWNGGLQQQLQNILFHHLWKSCLKGGPLDWLSTVWDDMKLRGRFLLWHIPYLTWSITRFCTFLPSLEIMGRTNEGQDESLYLHASFWSCAAIREKVKKYQNGFCSLPCRLLSVWILGLCRVSKLHTLFVNEGIRQKLQVSVWVFLIPNETFYKKDVIAPTF